MYTLLVDTGVEISVIRHKCFNILKYNGKKHHDIFIIMGKDKINMLGTSQLQMKKKKKNKWNFQ